MSKWSLLDHMRYNDMRMQRYMAWRKARQEAAAQVEDYNIHITSEVKVK